MKKVPLIFTFVGSLLALAGPVVAQHDHHAMEPKKPATVRPDSVSPKKEAREPMHRVGMNHAAMGHDTMTHADMNHGTMAAMSHAFSLSLPMNRNGSGTGWLPDATPMYAYMKHRNDWMLMLHGSVFLRYTSTNFNNPGKRGRDRFSAPTG